MSERKQGASIKPEDVKVGDAIGVTLVKKSITKTFTGEVGEIKSVAHDSEYRIIYCIDDETLWSSYWSNWETEIVLLKPAPEPHALENSEVGDYFEIKNEVKFGHPNINRYTKVRDDVWFVEQASCDGKVNQFCRINDSLTKAVFDQHKCKLVKLER